MAQFSPITTQSISQPQENPIDKALGVINNLIQLKSQSTERKFQQGQRSRLLQAQAEEDATNQAVGAMLSGKTPYTQQDVMMLADRVPQNKLNLLMQGATDYVDQTDAMINFTAKLPQLKTLDDFSAAVKATGLDKNTALRMWNEQQQMTKQEQMLNKSLSAGKGAGTNSEGNTNLLVTQANAVLRKKQLRAEGLNYGSYNVYIRGTDAAPRALVNYNGKVYRKTKSGYSKGVDGDPKSFKDIKDKNIADIPEEVRKSLDAAFTDFEDANRAALGKGTDRLSLSFTGTMNAR